MSAIAATAMIYDNVILGQNVVIEDYCIIGCPNPASKNNKTIIGNNAVIRSHTVIYAGNKIGNNFTTGNKANIRENNVIGDNVTIGTMSIIEYQIIIGSNVTIHSNVFIPELSIIEDNAWIGPSVILTNAKYPKSKDAKQNLKGPTIEQFVKIGAGSIVLPGVIIGDNSLIGAGSLITKNIPKNSVVYGSPAVIHGQLKEIKSYV